jgi:hypothetical protein
MVRMKVLTAKKIISALMCAGFVFSALPVTAQSVVHQTVVLPGGVPGVPVMSGINPVTNGMQITWNGPSGYYQVFQKSNNLAAAPWVALGKATNLNCTATITKLYSNAFFRVAGPAPKYAGYQACIVCHANVCRYETNTPHASAFADLPVNQQQNPSCLVCHTVGYGLPTGFVSASATPKLAGVQCENCHGPAARHAASPDDPTVVPRVDIAAQICGGCHSGSHQPTYEEWSASGHAAVVPEVVSSMAGNPNSITSCGRCHSGSARLALIAGQNPSVTVAHDYNVPIACAVCHNPHALSVWTNSLSGVITFTNTLTGVATTITNTELGPVYTNQLRSALASTEDFSLATSAVFTNVYNPNINVCGQCHNDRGAAWTDTARAPHHSPQYNMLIGTVGELATGSTPGLPATHSRLEKQCAECHMQTTNSSTGHTFSVVTYQLCYNCHTDPAGLIKFTTNSIASQIQETKFYLDYWATNVAPVAIPGLQKYGVYAWEYTSPGDLSPGGSGPVSADQKLIPDEIKKARFNVYLVLYDGSYGVHNAPYDVELLQAANAWVLGQISLNLMSNVIYVQSLF